MSMRRIALSSAWSTATRRDERSEPINEDSWSRFDALFQHYYPSVLAFLRFLVGSPEAAEDLASLVFEKALKHLGDVRAPGNSGSWLFSIARNCAADYFRHHKSTLSLERLLLTQHPLTPSLEDHAIIYEEQRNLLAHLDHLSKREREIIGLKFVADLNNREIARVLQIPEGTVSSLLYRTLRHLRVALSEQEVRDEE